MAILEENQEDIPPVAIEKALNRALGDKDFLLEMLEQFKTNGSEWLKSIESLLQKHDGETLAREAHALKGAASNLGAVRVAEFALRLEEMGRSGDLSEGIEVLGALEVELDSINQFIGDWKQQM